VYNFCIAVYTITATARTNDFSVRSSTWTVIIVRQEFVRQNFHIEILVQALRRVVDMNLQRSTLTGRFIFRSKPSFACFKTE